MLGRRWIGEHVWRARLESTAGSMRTTGSTTESTTAAGRTTESTGGYGEPQWHASGQGHHGAGAGQPGETRASRLGHWREDSTWS